MDDNHGFFSRFFFTFCSFQFSWFFVCLFICLYAELILNTIFNYSATACAWPHFIASELRMLYIYTFFSVCLPSSWLLLLAAAAAVACSLASFFHCLRSLFSNFVSLRVVVFSSIVFSPTIYLSLKLRTLNVYLLPVSVSLFFRLFIFLSVDCERGS